MDLRVFVLCLVILCSDPGVRGNYFDEFSTYERTDSNESAETSGTPSVSESAEYLLSNEYGSDEERDESLDVKSSSNILKTSFKSQNEPDRTQPHGSNDPVNEKSIRLREDFDDASESIACHRSSLPHKPPTSIGSKDQTEKAIKDENSKKSQNLRPVVECTSQKPGKLILPQPTPITDHYVNSPKDVEVILPPEKTLFLPLVNGKPKPYDGYRALPKVELYQWAKGKRTKESPAERERRLSLGEIIYGEPKMALSPKHLKKRSTLDEYDSKIQPEYDSNEEFFNSFEVKSSLEANNGENEHTFYSEESYEVSSEGNEDSEETKHLPTYAFENFYKAVGSQIQVHDESEKKLENKQISEKNNFHPNAKEKAIEDVKTGEQFIQTLPRLLNGREKPPVNEEKGSAKPANQNNLLLDLHETKKANLSQNAQDDIAEPSKSNKNIKTNNKKVKRSAVDATYFDSHHLGTKRYGKDKAREFGGPRFTDSKENSRNDYQRLAPFNFQSSNKKFSKGGHGGGFGGHNNYNIRNRQKTYNNWSEPTKKANSVNFEGKFSKVHDGSFTFENPKTTYGVPASIYSEMFQSSEEYDEPFEKVEVKNESPKERNYSHRTYSSGRYFNQYNRKHSERKEFHSHAVNRDFPEPRTRPKKNAHEYKTSLDDFVKGRGLAFAENHGGIKSKETRRPTEEKQPPENRVEAIKHGSELGNGQLRENKGDSNCRKERRGQMTCIVCTYNKNSTTREQCQYSTKESNSEKYLAYERQKSVQTNDERTVNDRRKPDEHSKSEGGSVLQKRPSETLKENESSGSSVKSSIAPKTRIPDTSQQSLADHHQDVGVFMNHGYDPRRFLRKTQQHGQTVKYEASTYPYEVAEEPAEDESTGEDGLTFASFGGDDFGAAFLEFGKHATEDMFHPKESSDEDFESNDRFDFDSMSFSFEETKSSEEA